MVKTDIQRTVIYYYFPCTLTVKTASEDKKKTKHKVYIEGQPEMRMLPEKALRITDASLACVPESKAVTQKMYGQF